MLHWGAVGFPCPWDAPALLSPGGVTWCRSVLPDGSLVNGFTSTARNKGAPTSGSLPGEASASQSPSAAGHEPGRDTQRVGEGGVRVNGQQPPPVSTVLGQDIPGLPCSKRGRGRYGGR